MDIYLAASALPTVFLSVFTNIGTFMLIPIFQDLRIKEGEKTAWRTASFVFTISTFLLVLVVIISTLFSSLLMKSPGFSTEQLTIAKSLIPIIWSSMLFGGLSSLLYYLHNCLGKFALAAFSMVFPNIGIIVFTIFCSRFLGGAISIASGQLIGYIVHFIFLLPFVFRKDKLRFFFGFNIPGIHEVYRLVLLLIGGGVIHNLLPVAERFFASLQEEGTISFLSYAARISYFFTNTFSIGVVTVIFYFFI